MDHRVRHRVLSAVLLSFAVPASAGAQAEAGAPVITTELIAKGKKIFQSTGLCLACHGMNGTGGVGPDLTDSIRLHPADTFEALVQLITGGVTQAQSKTGQIMPTRGGSGLKDPEVRAVAAYVWSLSRPGYGPPS